MCAYQEHRCQEHHCQTAWDKASCQIERQTARAHTCSSHHLCGESSTAATTALALHPKAQL